MKNLLLFLLISSGMLVFGQSVKFKKDKLYVDKEYLMDVEEINVKMIFSVDGKDIFVITLMEYGTGKYHTTGVEVRNYYSKLKFLNKDMEEFEVDMIYKDVIRKLYENNLIGKEVSDEEAMNFRDKYSENVSENRFLTK